VDRIRLSPIGLLDWLIWGIVRRRIQAVEVRDAANMSYVCQDHPTVFPPPGVTAVYAIAQVRKIRSAGRLPEIVATARVSVYRRHRWAYQISLEKMRGQPKQPLYWRGLGIQSLLLFVSDIMSGRGAAVLSSRRRIVSSVSRVLRHFSGSPFYPGRTRSLFNLAGLGARNCLIWMILLSANCARVFRSKDLAETLPAFALATNSRRLSHWRLGPRRGPRKVLRSAA